MLIFIVVVRQSWLVEFWFVMLRHVKLGWVKAVLVCKGVFCYVQLCSALFCSVKAVMVSYGQLCSVELRCVMLWRV